MLRWRPLLARLRDWVCRLGAAAANIEDEVLLLAQSWMDVRRAAPSALTDCNEFPGLARCVRP